MAAGNLEIGVGSTVKPLHLTDSELGRMETVAGLTIGDEKCGTITVNGITSTNSDTVGTLSLVATKLARSVIFKGDGPSVFSKGIIVQAGGGVVLSTSVVCTPFPHTLPCPLCVPPRRAPLPF